MIYETTHFLLAGLLGGDFFFVVCGEAGVRAESAVAVPPEIQSDMRRLGIVRLTAEDGIRLAPTA